MRKPKIGVDLDGVVVDFNGCWTAMLGLPVDVTERWDFLDVTPFKRWVEFWDWAREARVFGTAEPYPGALQGVKRLQKLGEVEFITMRPHWAKEQTLCWMSRHDLHIPVVYDVNKWVRRADLYVEDSPYQILDILANQRGARIIRVVRPWNEPVDGVVDATNWTEIVDAAKRWLKESGDGGHTVDPVG